mmetsp:Transcript_13353/g.28895  ORF Transcript_13353/g.28895 Transcript_13353/m.28895 type:complete len:97 (+) Transcript_13353:1145-1435(+)
MTVTRTGSFISSLLAERDDDGLLLRPFLIGDNDGRMALDGVGRKENASAEERMLDKRTNRTKRPRTDGRYLNAKDAASPIVVTFVYYGGLRSRFHK